MMSTLSYTLGQLAAHVGAEVRGDAARLVDRRTV
ncbi:hypothetical protein AAIH16_43890, partial [Pseudomonas aeruginosa]